MDLLSRLDTLMLPSKKGLSDQAVFAACPPDGWVRGVVEYGYQCSDAPSAYFLGSALSVLSLAMERTVKLHWGAKVNSCVWSMLVGAPGHSRKTAAASMVVDLLAEAYPDYLAGGEGAESAAALVELLVSRPVQLVFHGEFGDYLAGTSAGSYKANLRETYLKLWDGGRLTKIGKSSGEHHVDDPRVAMLACVAPGLLEKLTGEDDWTGGFMSRWTILLGYRMRDLTPPPEWPERRAALIEQLYRMIERPVGKLQGLDPAASAYMRMWGQAWERAVEHQQTQYLIGLQSRMQAVALKAALTFSLDVGAGAHSLGRPWQLDEYSVHWGCQVAELHLASARTLVATLAMSPYAKQRRSVLDALGSGMRTYSQLLRAVQPAMAKKTLDLVVESLEAEHTVFRRTVLGCGEPVFSRFASDAEASAVEAASMMTHEGGDVGGIH